MNHTIIEFNNFSFKYHAQAEPTLFDVNLKINKGEKVLVLGPSGSGKSTIAHCINGLIPFSYNGEMEGTLKIYDKETKDLSIFDISKMVGTVLQDSNGQFVGMTVGEDIAFALENNNTPRSEMIDIVNKFSTLVDMNDHIKHAPQELSGGQKQRVALAGILVDDVKILLFDEPLANLDPDTGKKAIKMIDDIKKEIDATVIIIEHRLEDCLYKDVDRIVLIENGKITFDGTPTELLISDKLNEAGIREPLYVKALKYANVDVKNVENIDSIEKIKIHDEDKNKIRNWFKNSKRIDNVKNENKILSVKNLNFTYDNGFKALKNINVDINEGEMIAIVGTNGAGKTTFSKVVCGFEKEQEGSIYFKNIDFKNLSIKERAEYVGYAMQNPNDMICEPMIYDEVAFSLRQKGIDEETIKEKVNKTLKICGLYEYRNWPVSALSFGQKKRLTIASILVFDTKMIIFDEPTAGQDFRHYTEIMEFLKELNKEGLTIIMITHDMHLMLEYADRVIVFSHGEIIEDSNAVNVINNLKIIEEANLKKTSLYDLADIVGIEDKNAFIECFINYDRENRLNGKNI